MDLCRNLKWFYKICRYTGLIHFTFSASEEKTERFYLQTIVNTAILRTVTILSGILLPLCLLLSIQEGEGDCFKYLQYGANLFMVFVYCWNYLKQRQTVTSIVNEVLKIYKCLRRETSSHLSIGFGLAELFALKVFFVPLQMRRFVFCNIFNVLIIPPYAMGLSMCFGYIYLQMVFICFYSKMNAYLDDFGPSGNSEHLQKFAKIWLRIHRVKRLSDAFFSPLFLFTYMNLAFDIQQTYAIVSVLLYSEHKFVADSFWDYINASASLVSMAYSLDVVIISLLSDVLTEQEEQFQRKMFEISLRIPVAEDEGDKRDLETAVFQRHVCGVEAVAFNSIQIGCRSGMRIIFGFVIGNVLMCLQLYPNPEVNNEQSG